MNEIRKNEWWFVSALGVLLIVCIISPFLYGFLQSDENFFYTGYHLLSPGDTSVYYSYIQQVYGGHIFFRDLFTHESVTYNMVNTFWLIPGIIGKIFHISVFWAFQFSKILVVPFLLYIFYKIISLFYEQIGKRLTTLFFILFSTGVSGIFAPFLFYYIYETYGYRNVPMDLWVSESNTFLSSLHSGHMMASLALLVYIFFLTLLFLDMEDFKISFKAGIFSLILFSFHPFPIPVLFAVLWVYTIVISLVQKKLHKKLLLHNIIIFICTSPMIAYYFWSLRYDPIISVRGLQNDNFTPEWYLLFFSFGFLLICACFGIYIFFKKGLYADKKRLFLLTWLLVQCVLIYSPLYFQRRLIVGLQVPLIFFTIDFLLYLKDILQKKLSKFFFTYFKNPVVGLIIFIFGFSSSNFFILGMDFYLNSKKDPIFYIQRNEKVAFDWIVENISEDDVILSHQISGYHIACFTGKQVFAGHADVETLFFEEKVKHIQSFYSSKEFVSQDERKAFLKNSRITYVYFGINEKNFFGSEFFSKDFLTQVYNKNNVEIYKVSL